MDGSDVGKVGGDRFRRMSERTLQRRLEEENVVLQALLDET